MNNLLVYLDKLKDSNPDNGLKDITLNIKKLLDFDNTKLSQKQIISLCLSCAISTKAQELVQVLKETAKECLSEIEINACYTASYMMGMTNIYYRFLHFTDNKEYSTIPLGLRMLSMKKHGINEIDFELYCLAVSAINGCSDCINAHEAKIKSSNELSAEQIQESIKIASLIHSISCHS